jgi:lipopolysaccharide biosynthesis glycosyltransferase
VKVGFLHVGQDDSLARIMVESARAFGYDLIHMTDEETPAIDGCHVVRIPWDKTRLMTYRLHHLAELAEPNLCVLDTDIIIRRDLSDVWALDFDVALTRRGVTLDTNGQDVAVAMPYNSGVMFCREPAFWAEAHMVCAGFPDKFQTWYGDQLAIKQAVTGFELLELDVRSWNYSPRFEGDYPEQARVLHFKGKRKDWMKAWHLATMQN